MIAMLEKIAAAMASCAVDHWAASCDAGRVEDPNS